MFPFFLFNNTQNNNVEDNWTLERFEFVPYKRSWLFYLGLRTSLDDKYSFVQDIICNRLDYKAESFVNNLEREFNCNPRYLDSRWIYNFEDGDDVINNIIEETVLNFELYMYPMDKELCNHFLIVLKKELFKIGRDFFSVQFENQSYINYKCRIGRDKNEFSDKILRW